MSRSIDARLRAIERAIKRRKSASDGADDIPIRWIGDDGQSLLGEVAPGAKVDYRRGLASLLRLAEIHDKTGSIESDAS